MPAFAVPVSKTSLPRLKRLLVRPQVVARLEQAARAGQVLLIVAPGGAGKTALAVAWATSTDLPVILYSLDPTDRDGRRLLAGIATSLERTQPGAAISLLDGLADPDMPIGALVERLLDGLGEAPITLVLDDLHPLEGAQSALHVLTTLLRLRPPTLALLLLGRVIPTVPLAGHVSTGSLAGLGWEELRLDGNEAQALLALNGLEGDGPALAARHVGWPVGILLEARGAVGSTAAAFTLLLAGLPAPLRRFALEAAVLADATAAQTDAILGRANSAACYAALAAQGLFVSLEGDIWHYHDLFAEACIGILEREDSGRLAASVEAATAHDRRRGICQAPWPC